MNLRNGYIKQLLTKQYLDSILVSSVPNITYLTNYPNFSKVEREAFLLITENNRYIFTDGRYTTAVKKYVKNFEVVEISSSYSFYNALEEIINKNDIKSLGLEESNITVIEYNKLKHIIPNLQSANLDNLRIIKTTDEISKIKKACLLGDKAFKHILKMIKSGLSERQIAYELEFFIKENGADLSFDTIVAFGENAAVPHHSTSNKKLNRNELILIDFGVKLNSYCSDMTRTLFIGKATTQQKKVYQIVIEAQQKAINYLQSYILNHDSDRVSISASGVDGIARKYIISQNYPSIPHSLGHGIGLEVHEPPNLSPVSKYNINEGMVFSIEPGIYLPGKFGVRIEDLFTVQNGKLLKLTSSPQSLIEL